MSPHIALAKESPLLRAILNLSKFHREHEKFQRRARKWPRQSG
jgi:hypothetical protein